MLFRVALQDAFQYRVEAMIWFLYDILSPIMMAFVWLAAYQSQGSVAGFSEAEMLTYTIGVMTLRTLITSHIEWGMDWEIRQGLLSTNLVKPLSMWGFWFVGEVAWKVVRAVLIAPVLAACLIWLGPSLGGTAFSADRLLLAGVSVVLGYFVCFLMKLCLGFVNFWTNDINGPATVYEVTASIVGGILVPLALLPESVQTVALLLPIQAVYNVPLSLLLGKDVGAAPWTGIAMQLGWIVLLWGLALVLWRAGLRRYEAVGG